MTETNGRILLVENIAEQATPMMYFLEKDHHVLFHAFTLGEARAILDKETIDVILLDLFLPDGKGTEILSELPMRFTQPPKTIVFSAHADPSMSALTIKLNAYEYLPKPVQMDELRAKVREALANRRIEARVKNPDTDGEFVVGNSPAMIQAMDLVQRFAPLDDFSILLVGETGVGKEHFARMVHQNSPRAKKEFVVADCTTFPKELVENELFGNVKGAFYGAMGSPGLVGQAQGGTLFLDEIHHLPLDSQVKLLRLLSSRSYRQLGSTTEKLADVRIVCATNRDLAKEVDEGRFFMDLFYRIKELTIPIPPLRDRKADIELLVAEFIIRANQQTKRAVKGLKPEVLSLFQDFRWTGNIRELKNAVRRSVVMCDGDLIGIEHLPTELQAFANGARRPRLVDKIVTEARPQDLQHSTDRFQESMLRLALTESNGNVSQAAKMLNVTRDIVRYMMKRFDIEADDFKDGQSV